MATVGEDVVVGGAPATPANPNRPGDQQVEDVRSTAVLTVLGGVPVQTVADRFGVAPGVLNRWVRTFIQAGRLSLSAGVMSPAVVDTHRDRYLGLIAHELRSPLTMIRGWTDILAGTEDPSLQDHALKAINHQTDRLRRLADDALDATSVALGRLELEVSARVLGDVVRDIVNARSLQPPQVLVEQPIRVRIDVDRFGQVIDNLLENARRHGSGPPTVHVRERGLFGEVVISSPGDPIPPQVAQRMFEPFERGTTSVEGVGLGLYVCRSLIVAHSGQIGLRVDEGGNHFWLRLPIEQKESSMTYEFACGDVMPGCAATFDADSKEKLFGQVAEHAKADHDINEITPEVKQAVEDKIKTTS